jgi:soluble lytic murein transglycosylase-like protein
MDEPVKKSKKFTILIFLVITGLMSLCVTGLLLLYLLQKELKDIKSTQDESHANQIRTNQLLLSSMDWATKRQKLILFMRDMIIDEWKRVGEKKIDISKAYSHAENIMKNVENFPQIDPCLVLSMGCVESTFGEKALSPKGAIGFLQLMPYTAKPYFEIYGIPFSDTLLFQSSINIKIGIRVFADIFSCYHSVETSVAVYNAGKWGLNYPNYMDKVPDETKKYVPSVMAKWISYKSLLEKYHVDSVATKDYKTKKS